MQSSIKILLILFLFNSTIEADVLTGKIYSFIGVQGSYTDYDNETAPTIGFKYGKQNDSWRTAISYNYAQMSDDTYHTLIMQVDAGVLTELFIDIPIKPYLGFSFGVMEDKNSDLTDRGFLYGINTGINYVVNNSLDIDFGYRYMSADKFKYIDNRGDFTLSLHYYFQ